MGAGSTVFVRNVLGDCLCSEVLRDAEFALYDIDAKRLSESAEIIGAMNETMGGHAKVTAHLGVENRKEALRGADFVVNAIQVGLYDPCTIIDFEVPKKYGLRQTIGDTLGIGGIAFALAAQDTVKNIFGAFTIFTDKPFGIGDTINVNGLEGTVIDVGMRSTRILGYDRRITSYPNYKITDASIVNISSEPMRRAMVKLGLTYDTGAEKMKQALEILRAIPAKIKDVSGNPSDVTAYFSDYTDSALVVTFYYYIEKQGDVLKTTSDVNLEILDSFAKAGLTFAFPTRTLLVHQDDAEKAGGEPAAADGTQIQNS